MKAARLGLVLLLAAGISIGGAVLGERWIASLPGQAPVPEGGAADLKTLPGFVLPDLDGRPVASADWAGKVVVLNYWASWCPPCVRELPLFASAQAALGGQGLQCVGIAIDRAADARAFLADRPVNYPILIGDPQSVELARRLGNRVQGLPFTAIFDRRGQRVFSRTGEMTAEDLRAQLARLFPTAPDTTR